MAPSNIFLDLTREFNVGHTRAVVCSGQAVVLHRLAIMSKDGDWILREDEEALSHVLETLASHRAAEAWRAAWPAVNRELEGLDLITAHARMRDRAERVLPFEPGDGDED